jgi:iron-sulfur cluster repair protein YtfE (RIC family)
MVNLGWSAPAIRVDAGGARRAILWQHQRIRELLDKARAVAEAALDGEANSPDAVGAVIADLHSTMEVHLSFEENILLPLFLANQSGGLPRARQLQDEHSRQREVLVAIHREARRYPQLPTLAAKLVFLTSWLLADMKEEERSMSTWEGAPDEVVEIPRVP